MMKGQARSKYTTSICRRVLAVLLILAMILSVPVHSEAAYIKLNKTKATVHVGKTVSLVLKNGTAVSWRSSNKSVATVTSKGVVRAKKKGTATITCIDKKGKKYKCKITVKNHINKTIKKLIPTKNTKGYVVTKCKVCGDKKKTTTIYNPDEADVYKTLIAQKSSYPEGTRWSIQNGYAWNAGIYSAGYGCAGFAFLLSDKVFGKYNTARKITSKDWYKKIKVGDIVRYKVSTGEHSVTVLKVKANSIVVVEGAYNNSVHWGREIPMSVVKSDGVYLMTRYPE